MKVRNLKLKITEESISRATGLPSMGEPFFKGGKMNVSDCMNLHKPPYHTLSWSKGVLHSCLEEKWHPLVTILQRFITCEGRYAVALLYHIRLLLHFSRDRRINIPHFLWLSLHNMARGVQFESKNSETSIYHHSLIKIIIVTELSKRRRTWEDFLIENFHGEMMQFKGRQRLIISTS